MASAVARGCIAQLQRRNRTQTHQFSELIESRTALLSENESLKGDLQRIKKELSLQTIDLIQLRESVSDGGCSKCAQMQTDLLGCQKEKLLLEQNVIGLNDKVQQLESKLERTEANLAASRSISDGQAAEILSMQDKLKQVEDALAVSIEECHNKSEEVDKVRARNLQLQTDNQELLKQLLKMKESEAERYNEIHSMMEEAESKRRALELSISTRSVGEAPPPPPDPTSVSTTKKDNFLAFGCTLPTAPKISVVAHERSEVHGLRPSSSGSVLVTGSDDRLVKLWDARNGSRLATLEGAVKAVMCVALSGDGNLALGASGDLAIRLWTIRTTRIANTLTGHTGKIYAAGFTPDSKGLYSGGYDRMLKVWDVVSGVETRTMHCTSSCNDAAISPEGAVLTSVHLDASIRLWDTRTGAFAHEVSGMHNQPITSVCHNPSNSNQVLTNGRDDQLCLVDVRKYDCVRRFKHSGYKNGVNWNRATMSPDGKYVVAGGCDGSLTVWDADSAEHATTLRGHHKSPVVACSWGDNDLLASAEKEHRMVLWQ